MMSDFVEPAKNTKTALEAIKKLNDYEAEYWSARDLMSVLGYSKWANFEETIERAMIACENAGEITKNHFADAVKMVSIGSQAGQRSTRPLLLQILSMLQSN